jgi:hypothetical protein
MRDLTRWATRASSLRHSTRCTDEEEDVVNKLTARLSILSRQSIMSMMSAKISFKCRLAVLASIDIACGARCVRERMHIRIGNEISPGGALPFVAEFVASLLASQRAASFNSLVSFMSPFGLSSTQILHGLSATDIYVPSTETLHGKPVYIGLTTENRMFRCSSADMWAVASFPSFQISHDCDLKLVLNTTSGLARINNSGSLALTIHRGIEDCPPSLMWNASEPESLTFETASSTTLSCVIAQLFAPYVPRRTAWLSTAGGLRWTVTVLCARPETGLVFPNVRILEQCLPLPSLSQPTFLIVSEPNCTFEQLIQLSSSPFVEGVLVSPGATIGNQDVPGAKPFVVIDLLAMSKVLMSMNAGNGSLRLEMVKRPGKLELAIASHIHLRADIVIGANEKVVIAGNGSTLSLGEHQMRVEAGGTLHINGMVVSNSVGSSALHISGGHVVAVGCTFRNCTASANAFDEYGVHAEGGAIRMEDHATMLVHDAFIGYNIADSDGALDRSYGGAAFVTAGSLLVLNGTHVSFNTARQTLGRAASGAIHISHYSNLRILDSELVANAVTGGQMGSGGALCAERNSSIALLNCSFRRNAVVGSNYSGVGGAVSLQSSSLLDAVDCAFESNKAEAEESALGGALGVQSDSTAVLVKCVFSGNLAVGLLSTLVRTVGFQVAGAVYVSYRSLLEASGCQFLRNRASNGGAVLLSDLGTSARLSVCDFVGNRASESGGAVFSSASTALEVTDCTFQGNSAEGNFSRNLGGAIFAGGIDAALVRCAFAFNEAPKGKGGAVYFDPPFRLAAVTGCEFADNFAQEGGGIFIYGSASELIVRSSNFSRNAAKKDDLMGNTAAGGYVMTPTVAHLTMLRFACNACSLSPLARGSRNASALQTAI